MRITVPQRHCTSVLDESRRGPNGGAVISMTRRFTGISDELLSWLTQRSYHFHVSAEEPITIDFLDHDAAMDFKLRWL